MNYIDSKIIPLAKEKGFDFSREDLLSYEKETLSKLNEEDLLNLSGGISFPSKKLESLLLAGMSLSGNLQHGAYATHGSVSENQGINQNQTEGQNEEQFISICIIILESRNKLSSENGYLREEIEKLQNQVRELQDQITKGNTNAQTVLEIEGANTVAANARADQLQNELNAARTDVVKSLYNWYF